LVNPTPSFEERMRGVPSPADAVGVITKVGVISTHRVIPCPAVQESDEFDELIE
jgi:hypothetical protein